MSIVAVGELSITGGEIRGVLTVGDISVRNVLRLSGGDWQLKRGHPAKTIQRIFAQYDMIVPRGKKTELLKNNS